MALHNKSNVSPFWVTDTFGDVADDSEVWNQAASSPLLPSSSFSTSASLSSPCLPPPPPPPPTLSPSYLPVLNQPSRNLTITDGWRSVMAQGCVCVCTPRCMLTCLYTVTVARTGIPGMKTCGESRLTCFTPFYMLTVHNIHGFLILSLLMLIS